MQPQILVAVSALYLALIALIAVFYRHRGTVDDYLTANRNAGAIQVSQGLFTLIGGGEFVTMASLGFSFGVNAVALFIGYAIAFFFMAVKAPVIRASATDMRFVSLPDYIHYYFGPVSGIVVFGFSAAAFFALLMLQFSSAATVLTPLTGVPYYVWVALLGFAVVVYLLLGGLKAVLVTDVIQGVAMLALLPIVLYSLFNSVGASDIHWFGTESLSPPLIASLVITGFLVAASSADVWQRAYAARSNQSASLGFVAGGLLFLVYGVLLAMLGIAAKYLGVSAADNAFVEVVTKHLPFGIALLGVVLVIAAISSTADTEIFVVASMLKKELPRLKLLSSSSKIVSTTNGVRAIVVFVAGAAMLASVWFRELVPIYTWLLSALAVISPAIVFSLFVKTSRTGMAVCLVGNAIIFTYLVHAEILNLDNIYLIAVPGLALYAVSLIFPRDKKTAS